MKNPPLEFVSSPQGRTTHRETKGGVKEIMVLVLGGRKKARTAQSSLTEFQSNLITFFLFPNNTHLKFYIVRYSGATIQREPN